MLDMPGLLLEYLLQYFVFVLFQHCSHYVCFFVLHHHYSKYLKLGGIVCCLVIGDSVSGHFLWYCCGCLRNFRIFMYGLEETWMYLNVVATIFDKHLLAILTAYFGWSMPFSSVYTFVINGISSDIYHIS